MSSDNKSSGAYDPHALETKWYELWEERGYFHANPASDKPPFSIVIPPPNVTGVLHMGHALNNTLQDVLARYKRMDGYETLWMLCLRLESLPSAPACWPLTFKYK